MKTLELKHIAPYLEHKAFGLSQNGSLFYLSTGSNMLGKGIENRGIDTFINENYKLILRPLSQLTQDKKTCAEINLLLEPNGLEINNFLLLRNSILNVAISWQEMQEVLNILYREHYDVFGLIEQKLAIEKL